MSLENLILDLIHAVKENTKAIKQASIAMPTEADITPAEPKAGDWVPQEDREGVVTAEPTASAPVDADTEQDASNDDDNSDEPEAAAPTTDEAATAVAPTKPVDKDAVINAMKACLLRTDKSTVVKILKKYNVSRVSDLDSRDLASALADFESAVLEDLPF